MRIPPQPVGLARVQQRIAAIRARFGATAGGAWPALGLGRAPARREEIAGLLGAAAQRYGLAPALLRAVAQVESGLRPEAVSPAGALGLMQLMPATARRLGVSDPFDPAASAEAGARYLSELLGRFGGDLPSALAAYNAGPGAVERYGGVPPYAETRRFVARVLELLAASPPPGE